MQAFIVLLSSLFASLSLAAEAPTSIASQSAVAPQATGTPSQTLTTTVTPGKLRYIENSGVCETTPGVYQASGYADVLEDESMWFWFFAARENPDTAPLAIWFNGGPGTSSMVGLFQENGPCRFVNNGTLINNPQSWNRNVNMLYIDQPNETGYSYGGTWIGKPKTAAEHVWKMLQIFFADPKFSKYATRKLGIWSESYGGVFGPVMSTYILSQNAAIDAKQVTGTKINLQVLGISNGLTDSLVQFPSFVTYAKSNPYHQYVSDDVIQKMNTSLHQPQGCLDQIRNCYRDIDDNPSTCSAAYVFCLNNAALIKSDYWMNDVREARSFFPDMTSLLENPDFKAKIGAQGKWKSFDDFAGRLFIWAGGVMTNARPDLEKVVDAGIRVLIMAGDADYQCNYFGVEALVEAMQTKFMPLYKQQKFQQWTINGKAAGQFKTADTLSYLRIYGAGHFVPVYGNGELEAGAAARTYFTQAMLGKPLESV